MAIPYGNSQQGGGALGDYYGTGMSASAVDRQRQEMMNMMYRQEVNAAKQFFTAPSPVAVAPFNRKLLLVL